MSRLIKRVRYSSQKGMALSMTAVCLPLFAVIMAFAVDIGMAQTAQSRLEAAVSRGADAGMTKMPDQESAARTARAVAFLGLEDSARFGSELRIDTNTTATELEVMGQMRARAFFGGLIGRQGYDLSATSTRVLDDGTP